MDKTALVAADFATGLSILNGLDRSDLAISVAMWVFLSEYEDWRFGLSSKRLDNAAPLEAYRLVHDALDKAGFPAKQTPPLIIFKMNDPFVRELRRSFAKTKSVEGMRLGLQLIGDRFVEDAIVYRIR